MKIHGFPVPEAVHRVGRDVESIASVGLFQGFAGSSLDGRPDGTDRQEASICPPEDEPLGNPAFDLEPAFVHRPMMDLAEQHQIVRARLASFGPVLDVVGLQVTGSRAARELAGSIPADQGPPERC